MDEGMAQQVAGSFQGFFFCDDAGAAHRKHIVLKQKVSPKPGVFAFPEADGDIHVFAVKIDNRMGDVNPDIGAGVES
jgi:elongation factor P hydroxylase